MSVLAVIELPHRPLLKRGSTVTLLCNVSVVITGPTQVEVQWWHEKRELDGKEDMPPGHAKGSILATLTYDGLSRIYSNGSELSIDRVSAGTYRLRIFSAHEDDQGDYHCQAEVWTQDPRGAWYNTGARAESATVHVYLYARGKFKEIEYQQDRSGPCDCVALLVSLLPLSFCSSVLV